MTAPDPHDFTDERNRFTVEIHTRTGWHAWMAWPSLDAAATQCERFHKVGTPARILDMRTLRIVAETGE